MSACPHCGSGAGYFIKVTYVADQWHSWDEEHVDHPEFVRIAECVPRCLSCKKSVKKFIAKEKDAP